MLQFELVDVATLNVDRNSTVSWGSSAARDEGQLLDYGSLIYGVDDRTLVATATEEKIDGRSDPHARRIRADNRRHIIPIADFEAAWDMDLSEADGRKVAVWAREGAVALRLVEDLVALDLPADVVDVQRDVE